MNFMGGPCNNLGSDVFVKPVQAQRWETMTKSAIWWERAHEYRSLAQDAQNPSKRVSYSNIAENCARVARRLEELEEITGEGPAAVTESREAVTTSG